MSKSQVDTQLIDRELSWLSFNERVLAEAIHSNSPLLERIGFLQIFNSNLDEFFMKRVGGLKRQVLAKVPTSGLWNVAPQERLLEIRGKVLPLLQSYADCLGKDLVPALKKEGVELLKVAQLTPDEIAFITQYFRNNVYPVLTPLAVDPGHPFPFISNLSASFGILMKNPSHESEELFARVKVPPVFPSWIRLPKGENPTHMRFVSLYEVVGLNLHLLFPGMEILDVMMFRVTRNADIETDAEDAEDLLEMVAEELKERRFAEVVRLEHGPKVNQKMLAILREELDLHPDDVYELPLLLEYYSLKFLIDLERHDLHYQPWVPVVPAVFSDPETTPFDVIRQQDVLVHHPYESFTGTVERFLKAAVDDKKVLAIKMTLYRTGEESNFIPLLIRAAEAGKQVVCLVELQARFDEERNILVAQALEKAGVHVVYGVVGLKTHCKIALVIRQDQDAVRSFVHVGTGNYNARTASVYTDVGLFTCKPDICDDVVHLFHYLTGRSLEWRFKKLLIAPIDMKETFLRLIERESALAKAGKPAKIIAKMNSLEDLDVIQALYAASDAGVKIELFVRGICCLRPGVENLSRNIRVFSIIGRFLEHSRIFFFQNGKDNGETGEFFIGSADWMSRNLHHRVEVIAPVEDENIKKQLMTILNMLKEDRLQSWELQNDGQYRKLVGDASSKSAHGMLMDLALASKIQRTS